MPDTKRTIADLLAMYADNVTGQITAQHGRDLILSVLGTGVNPSEPDQGAAGDGYSAKDLIDSKPTESATLVFRHTSAGDTTTYTFSTNETIPSHIAVIIEKGAVLSLDPGVTLTINGPFEAGLYQVFSGAGSVSFGSGSVEEIKTDWFYDGTNAEAAIESALAAVTYGTPIPVILPAGLLTVTGTIALPKGTILKGANEGGEITAIRNPSYIYHSPAGADVELFTTDSSAGNPVQLSNFFIAGSQAGGISKSAINFAKIVKGSIKNVIIYGRFATAAVVLSGSIVNLDIDGLIINNQDTTTAMPAGILVTRTIGLNTTIKVRNLYIQGHATSATGGITKGVVVESDSVLSMTFYSPIIESITQTAWDIDCGNTVDIISPYTENIPNTDVAYALFNVGLTTPGASYGTFINISGGIIGGGNYGYTNNFLFSLGKYDKINVIDVQFQRIYTFMEDDATDHLGIISVSNSSGAVNTFGTATYGKNWDWSDNNRIAGQPTVKCRSFGSITDLPTYYLSVGQKFYNRINRSTYIYTNVTLYSFTYNTGSHEPTLGQTIYGETSAASIIIYGKTNTGGWAGAGTGTLYYYINSGTPVTGEHFHEAAGGAGNLVCNTTSGNTSVPSSPLKWRLEPGGRAITLGNVGTPDLADGTGFVPITNHFRSGGTTAITDFLNGQVDQVIQFIAYHNVTITHGLTILLSGSVNFNMVSGDTLTLKYDAVFGAWVELARR